MTEQAIQNIHVHAFDDENDALTWQWTVPSDFTLAGGNANISLVAPQVTEDTQYTLTVKVSDGQLSSEKSFVVTVTNLAAAGWKSDSTYVGGDKVTQQEKLHSGFNTRITRLRRNTSRFSRLYFKDSEISGARTASGIN
jgi:hypothetical protein